MQISNKKIEGMLLSVRCKLQARSAGAGGGAKVLVSDGTGSYDWQDIPVSSRGGAASVEIVPEVFIDGSPKKRKRPDKRQRQAKRDALKLSQQVGQGFSVKATLVDELASWGFKVKSDIR